MSNLVLGVDQGTTSTRAILFDVHGHERGRAQARHAQSFPRPGWVEQDPLEILSNTRALMADVMQTMSSSDRVLAVGIANQTETIVVWDRRDGQPIHPAITWQDVRGETILNRMDRASSDARETVSTTLVELNSYFSATKIAWILDHVTGARERAEAGELAFGTVESWLCWNLTGGPHGGEHATDLSNASRTLLLDVHAAQWSAAALRVFDIPPAMMPRIVSTSEVVGHLGPTEALPDVPIAGMMGDQQAAAFGVHAFDAGEAKNTYGTGSFFVVNTGEEPVTSCNGLITTVAYRCGDEQPRFGLEGSVAVAGSLITWLREGLGVLRPDQDVEQTALSVPDSAGASLVPAFSGLHAPRWNPRARGTIVGLTQQVTGAHLVRAALDAVAFQTAEVLNAATADLSVRPNALRVDGGMAENGLLMQTQADLLDVPVVASGYTDMTSLGVAYAAGLAVGFWTSREVLRQHEHQGRSWFPAIRESERVQRWERWHDAVAAVEAWVVAVDGHRDAQN